MNLKKAKALKRSIFQAIFSEKIVKNGGYWRVALA